MRIGVQQRSVRCPEGPIRRACQEPGYGDAVRWEWLFGDLEAQLDADERAGFEAELTDLVRAERAAVTLRDRLRAHVGCDVALHLVTGDVVRGGVHDVGPDWVLLRSPGVDVLVPSAAVVGVA